MTKISSHIAAWPPIYGACFAFRFSLMIGQLPKYFLPHLPFIYVQFLVGACTNKMAARWISLLTTPKGQAQSLPCHPHMVSTAFHPALYTTAIVGIGNLNIATWVKVYHLVANHQWYSQICVHFQPSWCCQQLPKTDSYRPSLRERPCHAMRDLFQTTCL